MYTGIGQFQQHTSESCSQRVRNLAERSWTATHKVRNNFNFSRCRNSSKAYHTNFIDAELSTIKINNKSNKQMEDEVLTFTPPESFASGQFWGIDALVGGLRFSIVV